MRPIQLQTVALKPGDVLGRHELLMPIAKGGMGQVWAARLHGTRGFQKLVAVKTILPTVEDAGNLETMLFEEASLAALVRHPNVVETIDLGEREDGTLYLVMEWVSGEPLDHILHQAEPVGGVPTAMLVHFAKQALCGLRAVHEARNARGEPLGIVHRDVSPQNLLVTYEGVVKLIDFGIAKATQQMSRPTEDGMVKGKFAYMSPEHLRNEPLDARADLFSLGVTLYRATTGVHPFHSSNLAATMRNILMIDPEKPSALVPGYSASLEAVVLKALSKDRSERFASAQEMMLALEQAVPEARASGIEKQCEAFLRQLFHERIDERARALQAALRTADKAGKAGDIGPLYVRSQSTMRAVSREMIAASGQGDVEPEIETTQGESRPPGVGAQRRIIRSVAVALGVGALLVTGLVGLRSSSSHAVEAGGAAGGANAANTGEAPTAVGGDTSRATERSAPQSTSSSPLLSAPLPPAGSSASAFPSGANLSRPSAGQKKHAPQVAEPRPVASAAGGVNVQSDAGARTVVDVDPLSRRR